MSSKLSVLLALFAAGGDALSIQVRARYPLAEGGRLALRGSGCGLSWELQRWLEPIERDAFGTELSCEPGERGELQLLLDGKVGQLGAHDVFTAVAEGQLVALFPWFHSTRGNASVVMKEVWSPELQNHRDVALYLPPSFTENPYKVYDTVLIAGDGQNLFDPQTSTFGECWLAQEVLDLLIATGEMGEVLVVAPYYTRWERCDEYCYDYDASEKCGGKADLYLDFVGSTLLQKVAAFLGDRVAFGSSSHFAILGSSLGGLLSCYAAWTRPTMYKAALCMSPSMWWNNEDFVTSFVDKGWSAPEVGAPRPTLYLDVGGHEVKIMRSSVSDAAAAIGSHGWTEGKDILFYAPPTGEHDENSWHKRLHVPLKFVFGCGAGILGQRCVTPTTGLLTKVLVA